MNTDLIRSLVGLVEAEEQNRENARSSMSPEAAHYQATFYDTPLVNELCLLVLLFIWHKVEKEIVLIAALSSVPDDSPISRDDYGQKVERLESLRSDKRGKELKNYSLWTAAHGTCSMYCVYLRIHTSTIHSTSRAKLY
jgi:hypothetical protein